MRVRVRVRRIGRGRNRSLAIDWKMRWGATLACGLMRRSGMGRDGRGGGGMKAFPWFLGQALERNRHRNVEHLAKDSHRTEEGLPSLTGIRLVAL